MILESEGNEQVDFMTRVKYMRKKKKEREIKKERSNFYIFYIFFFLGIDICVFTHVY